MVDTVEEDLMGAMNAALEDSENLGSVSGHSGSLNSIDVMDEAMSMLLSGDTDMESIGISINIDGTLDERDKDTDSVDEGVEQIDFDDFLSMDDDAVVSELKAPEPKADDTDHSPKSVVESHDETEQTAEASESEPQNEETTSKDETEVTKDKSQKGNPDSQLQVVVPLKQFENALALIQDLENRIHVLETDQQCLLEENEQLRETTNNQATVLAEMEAKLEKFPKLLEQTVQEEAVLAAAKAEAETKSSFWRKDLARQEQEYKQEKLKKSRAGKMGGLTTESLQQSDFLKDIVDRKDQEEQKDKKIPALPKGPGGILMAFGRGLGSLTGNNNSSKKPDDAKDSDSSELLASNSTELSGDDNEGDNANEAEGKEKEKEKGDGKSKENDGADGNGISAFKILRGWGGFASKKKSVDNSKKDTEATDGRFAEVLISKSTKFGKSDGGDDAEDDEGGGIEDCVEDSNKVLDLMT